MVDVYLGPDGKPLAPNKLIEFFITEKQQQGFTLTGGQPLNFRNLSLAVNPADHGLIARWISDPKRITPWQIDSLSHVLKLSDEQVQVLRYSLFPILNPDVRAKIPVNQHARLLLNVFLSERDINLVKFSAALAKKLGRDGNLSYGIVGRWLDGKLLIPPEFGPAITDILAARPQEAQLFAQALQQPRVEMAPPVKKTSLPVPLDPASEAAVRVPEAAAALPPKAKRDLPKPEPKAPAEISWANDSRVRRAQELADTIGYSETWLQFKYYPLRDSSRTRLYEQQRSAAAIELKTLTKTWSAGELGKAVKSFVEVGKAQGAGRAESEIAEANLRLEDVTRTRNDAAVRAPMTVAGGIDPKYLPAVQKAFHAWLQKPNNAMYGQIVNTYLYTPDKFHLMNNGLYQLQQTVKQFVAENPSFTESAVLQSIEAQRVAIEKFVNAEPLGGLRMPAAEAPVREGIPSVRTAPVERAGGTNPPRIPRGGK